MRLAAPGTAAVAVAAGAVEGESGADELMSTSSKACAPIGCSGSDEATDTLAISNSPRLL